MCVCVRERAQLLTVKFCQNVECVFYLLITISVCVEYSRHLFLSFVTASANKIMFYTMKLIALSTQFVYHKFLCISRRLHHHLARIQN